MQRLPAGLKAVFFDMDGTLIDSEPLTELAVQAIVDEYKLPPPSFLLADLHGKTWARIEKELQAEYPSLAGVPLIARMEADFDAQMRAQMPQPIGGAVEAFRAASRHFITAIVSSSPLPTIRFVADKLGLANACHFLVGAEDVRASKPQPECYLVAASNAQVLPGECLVFEDSEAGLEAARAAGSISIAVIGNREAQTVTKLADLADSVIPDYAALPADFFTPPESAS